MARVIAVMAVVASLSCFTDVVFAKGPLDGPEVAPATENEKSEPSKHFN
jgi:hypothetical protein